MEKHMQNSQNELNDKNEPSCAEDLCESTESGEAAEQSEAVASEIKDETAESAESTESVEATESTESVEAIESAESAESAESSESVESAESAESTESTESTEPTEPEKSCEAAMASPKRRLIKRIMLIVGCTAILILAVLGAAVGYACMPVNIEVGEAVSLPAFERIPLLDKLCQVDTDLDSIDTEKIGEHELKLVIFGVFEVKSSLNVRDTVAPKLTTRSLYIMSGCELTPEDFVASAEDSTEITLSFEGEPDTASDGTATIIAVDGGGNITTVRESYKIDKKLDGFTFEPDVTIDDIKKEIQKEYSFDTIDLDEITFTDHSLISCGIFKVKAQSKDGSYLFSVTIIDTIAPDATVHSFDLLLGQNLAIEDFITDVMDNSDVEISYLTEPDFTKLGKQSIEIKLEDEYGNSSVKKADIYIHNAKSKLVLEAGTATIGYIESVRQMFGSGAAAIKFDESFDTDNLAIGTYETQVSGEYSPIPLEIVIVDTTPPRLKLREFTTYIGALPEPQSLIESCYDKSDVQISYQTKPDVSKAGDLTVGIIAIDASGNKTVEKTVLHVKRDNDAPVIYGVKNLTAYEGDSISYRQGVYAEDAHDGKVTVTVDASKVKTSTAGTYKVTYTATDKQGNTAKKTANVTIKAITIDAVNPLADKIIAQITTKSMTERQKARAIYDWCIKNIRYSTTTSHLMGYFAKAAYSGFKLGYGNCYTYYAVASVLLTRAGITNTMIQRNSTVNPHYWNLVQIGGKWYHFDTCPQPSPHKLEVFLLTTNELSKFTKQGYYSFTKSKYPATPN